MIDVICQYLGGIVTIVGGLFVALAARDGSGFHPDVGGAAAGRDS